MRASAISGASHYSNAQNGVPQKSNGVMLPLGALGQTIAWTTPLVLRLIQINSLPREPAKRAAA
jgi:hypothetical protein